MATARDDGSDVPTAGCQISFAARMGSVYTEGYAVFGWLETKKGQSWGAFPTRELTFAE